MVRVISSGFSTPRSRHSSGEEMIDRFAALKAISALNELDKQYDENSNEIRDRTLVIATDTDTNDSFSGVDSDEDIKGTQGATGTSANQNDVMRRKQRRRERNKLSAQNYRLRRREQTAAAEKTLETLEAKNKDLLEKVRHLEAEKHIVEDYLKSCVKIPWCPYHHPCKPMNCTPTNTNIPPPKSLDGNNGNILPPLPLNGIITPLTPPQQLLESPSSTGSGLDNAGAMEVSGSDLSGAGATGVVGSGLDNAGAIGMSLGMFENNNIPPTDMRMEERMPSGLRLQSSMPLSMRNRSDMPLRMSRVSPIMESSSSGSSVS